MNSSGEATWCVAPSDAVEAVCQAPWVAKLLAQELGHAVDAHPFVEQAARYPQAP